MKENFLHFIWKNRRFDQYELMTNCGEKITIVETGTINHHDGPDFLNAKIRIGDQMWMGSVEIHVDGRDWYRHKHDRDQNYSNVVLHVVYNNSITTKNKGGHDIPTLELGGLIPLALIDKHEQLLNNHSVIACANHIRDIDEFLIYSWKERLVAERLESKVEEFEHIITAHNGDWEATFFTLLATQFGLYANKNGFELLANSIDYKILLKHKSDVFQLEALLFGQSGLLNRSFKDDYPNRLKAEYKFLQKKYKLEPIAIDYWNFKGLRPVSFPTIRIAQLANLIHQKAPLFSAFQDCTSAKKLLMETVVSAYWQTHYTFDRASSKIDKSIGDNFSDLILINAYIPMLFAYGKAMGIHDLSLYACELLTEIKAESNRKTKLWTQLGLRCNDAGDSQAMIHAINNYCLKKKCLSCPIGCQILKGDNHFPEQPSKVKEASYIYN